MKLSKILLTLLLATSCLADNQPIRNDTPTALRDLAANLNVGSNYAVNKYGQLQCLAVVGDGGATSAYKFEDAASANGDAGVPIMAIYRTQASNAVSTVGDYAALQVDSDGRLTINPHGAHVGEFFQSCSSAATGTTDVAIKAAVASWRIYTTSLNCFNNSAVASLYNLDDGASSIWQFALSANTLGEYQYSQTFNPPLRGTVNTALNIKPTTNATSTICCAAGYISVN